VLLGVLIVVSSWVVLLLCFGVGLCMACIGFVIVYCVWWVFGLLYVVGLLLGVTYVSRLPRSIELHQ